MSDDKLKKESERKLQEKLDKIIEPLIDKFLKEASDPKMVDIASFLYESFAVAVLEGIKLADQVNDGLDKALTEQAEKIVAIEQKRDFEEKIGIRPSSKTNQLKDAVAIMNSKVPLVSGQPRFYIPDPIKKGIK